MANKEPSYLDFHCLQMYVQIYLMSEATRLKANIKNTHRPVFKSIKVITIFAFYPFEIMSLERNGGRIQGIHTDQFSYVSK